MTFLRSILLGVAVSSVRAGSVWAVPTLQLGANPSIYNPVDQSIQATANPFTLFALGNKDSAKFSLGTTYYLSLAITKHNGAPMTLADKNFGSFSISGVGVPGGTKTYAFSDLVFGTPPFEANLDHDSHDLGKHSIFPTYFAEISFQFDASKRSTTYNVQDNPNGFAADPTGGLYYQNFNVNITGLAEGYDLHFDLYDEVVKRGGDVDVDNFAPFSHDAVSGPHTNVPDAANTLALFGIALVGLGSFRYRFASK